MISQFADEREQQLQTNGWGAEGLEEWPADEGDGQREHARSNDAVVEEVVEDERAPRSLVFLLERPACMRVRPLSLPYLSRDVHSTTKGYFERFERERGRNNRRSDRQLSRSRSHLSSTASSNSRNRNCIASLHSMHSTDGIKSRLRMSGSSGYAHGSSLGRHRREMTALLMPKRSKDRVIERTLQQTKSTTYARSSSGAQHQSRTVQHQKPHASPVRVSPEIQSMLRREALNGHMILSLDGNGELAFSGTLQKASMYDLSKPFGRTRTFQAFGSQSGSDSSHAVSGAQPSQREKSRRREGAKAEGRRKTAAFAHK
jgi:hypothetical protein